jgi:hypothetical protein
MHIGHTWFGSAIWRVIIQSTNTLDHLKAVEQARTNFNGSGSHNYTAERLFRKVAGKKMQTSLKQLICKEMSIMTLTVILFCACMPDPYRTLAFALN